LIHRQHRIAAGQRFQRRETECLGRTWRHIEVHCRVQVGESVTVVLEWKPDGTVSSWSLGKRAASRPVSHDYESRTGPLLHLQPPSQQDVEIFLPGDSTDVHGEPAVGQTESFASLERMEPPPRVEALEVNPERHTHHVLQTLMLELLNHRLRWCDRGMHQSREASDVAPRCGTRAPA
jgi:hypothetical protein